MLREVSDSSGFRSGSLFLLQMQLINFASVELIY